MTPVAQELTAPFPWFGGKRRAAHLAWQAFGQVKNYVEPFAGSLAVLLVSPAGQRTETVNDLDGLLVNFWRAVQHAPDAVAQWADWPVTEIDLFARHMWLVQRMDDLRERLQADPDHHCPQTAGWWLWGICAWLGSGWCDGRGPWRVVQGKVQRGHGGDGGVFKRLPHLGDSGRGVHSLSMRQPGALTRHMQHISQRLRHVRVTCGDWQRVLTEPVTHCHGSTAVFLDPPYTDGKEVYAAGGCGGDLAASVRDWCATHGHHPDLRIILCGRGTEHDALLSQGWTKRHWTAGTGYARHDAAKARRPRGHVV